MWAVGVSLGETVANPWDVGLISPERGAWCFPRMRSGICVGHRLSSMSFFISVGRLVPNV